MENRRTIEVTFPGRKRVDAQIGDRTIHTDQPEAAGGEGSAPEPFNLFLASIATCAGVYALQFCQAREISTLGMGLTMSCSFDEQQRRYTRMEISLKLPGGFPEKYRDAIVRAMDLCAVKKHLANPPEFVVGTEP